MDNIGSDTEEKASQPSQQHTLEHSKQKKLQISSSTESYQLITDACRLHEEARFHNGNRQPNCTYCVKNVKE